MAASIAFPSALTAIWLPAPSASKRARSWNGTPEVFFNKEIDNSRLVKVADRKRNREIVALSATLAIFFALVMVYAWQHFSAVEYGYRIEALKTQRDGLAEANRALRLEQASLTDPQRIDAMARKIGLSSPEPGQMMSLDSTETEPGAPVMARVAEIAVVTAAP